MTNKMDMDFLSKMMGLFILDNGGMIKCMDKVCSCNQMVIYIKVLLYGIRRLVMVCNYAQMALLIMEAGLMESNKV